MTYSLSVGALQDRVAHLLLEHELRVLDDRLDHRRLEAELVVLAHREHAAPDQLADEVAEQRTLEEFR